MTRFHITRKSANSKVGPIPVSTTSEDTCPPSCPLYRHGCYAKGGPLAIHWANISGRANPNNKRAARPITWEAFLAEIRSMPHGQLWRHNQAGDLPGSGESIDAGMMAQLVNANRGKRGFTYTHKKPTAAHIGIIRAANRHGFTVNWSANNLAEADDMKALNAGPVAVILPAAYAANRSIRTPAGNVVSVCPAIRKADVTCATCKLCAVADSRRAIVGFPVHGSGKRAAENIALGAGYDA